LKDGSPEAKRCTDDVLERKPGTLTFPAANEADSFCSNLGNSAL
jgi:hypothetical protein